MDFDLPPELAGSRPRCGSSPRSGSHHGAWEIDLTEEYPQDLFDLFVETGLAGLCVPEEYGGSGAGILGLAIAIEEVAKYSNAAALMLLLTRLPTGPFLIAGSEELKHKYLTPITTGEQRAAFGLSEPQAGSDVMGMRTKAVTGWRRLGHQRHEVLDVRRGPGRLVLHFREDRTGRLRAHDSISALMSSGAGMACRSGGWTRRWA